MTLFTTTPTQTGISPDAYAQLIVQPVERESVALQVSSIIDTIATRTHIPIVTGDPSAGFVAEGAEITPSDPTIDDLVVVPSKVAGLTVITRELAADTSPQAASIVGAGLARDIAKKIDAAYFGNTTTNGPSGLLSLTGKGLVDLTAAPTNLDPFAQAMMNAENVGAQLNHFVGNPTDVLALMNLKDATGSNKPLLGIDPTNPTRRVIFGVPLVASPAVAAGVIWGIPKAKVFVVRREEVSLEVDRSVYFTSDRVAIKATMRIGFGFPHKAAVQKIEMTAAAG